MNKLPDHAAALTALLTESGRPEARVEITGAASLGAQRITLLIDIHDGDLITPAVAQISTGVLGAVAATDEAELIRLASAAGVPVPEVLAATDHLPGAGQPAIVSARVAGESIPRRILRALPRESDGDALAAECGAALACVHRIDLSEAPDTLPGIDSSNPYASWCDQLEADLNRLPVAHPAIRIGIDWLRRNQPSGPDSLTVVHGDLRNGNILVEQGRLAAVLDWELAHISDPMEDLGYLCLRTWRFGVDARVCGGFGSLEALRRGYESAGGQWRTDAFNWWMTARTAWWAVGLAMQGTAFSAGLTDSIVLAASGRRVPELEYDLLNLIES